MKTIKIYSLLIAFLLLGNYTSAQTVSYYVLEDSADLIASSYIDLVYFDYEGSMSNQLKYHKGVPGGLATLRADMLIKDPLAVEAQFGFGWFGEKMQVVRPIRFEGGVNMRVSTKYRKQDIKVHLRSYKVKAEVTDKTSGTYLGQVDAIKTEFIQVPAKKKFETFGRIGLMYQQSSYLPTFDSKLEEGSYNLAGAYLGMAFTRKAYLRTLLNDKIAISSEYMKIYADLLIQPLATTTTEQIAEKGFLGFRFGVFFKIPGQRHFMNYSFPKIEFGKRALDGWYWNVGLGMNLYKR